MGNNFLLIGSRVESISTIKNAGYNIVGKKKPNLINYIAAGIYILSSDFQIVTKNKGKVDMPELLSLGKKAGFRIGLFPLYEKWTGLGSPENLDEEGYK